MAFLDRSDEILSVGEFSRRFKMLVKTQVPELWLRGEVSNLKTYSSGHTYFTLKDADASISAVLFKGYSAMLSFPLRDGMKMLAYGEVSVYEPRGSYQLIVKAAMPDGAGDLAQRFEQLKQKLSREGLFDPESKKSIPRMPQNIALITSASGAALRDFCRILKRRGWRGNVYILPARVQGAEAASEIVSQIRYAQNSKFCFDLIVLTRGGGSLEDLWPFNEEIVARAVAASKIPTISAVGHEIDFTLCDFAADLRAETPSGAAELISSNFINCMNEADAAYEMIVRTISSKIDSVGALVAHAADVLRLNAPTLKIQNLQIRLDEIQGRADRAVFQIVSARANDVESAAAALKNCAFLQRIKLLSERINSYQKRLSGADVGAVLRRGFSIVRDAQNRVVKSSQLKSGDDVKITFFDGDKRATIK